MTVFLLLMLLAFVCFAVSAFGVASRINLVSAGLAFMALAFALHAGLLA